MPFGRIQGGREIFICLFIRVVTDELLATAFVANNLSDQTTILAIKSHLAQAFSSANVKKKSRGKKLKTQGKNSITQTKNSSVRQNQFKVKKSYSF